MDEPEGQLPLAHDLVVTRSPTMRALHLAAQRHQRGCPCREGARKVGPQRVPLRSEPAPTCPMWASWLGLEVHYRWNPTRSVHPLVSVAFDGLETGYLIRTRGTGRRLDSAQSPDILTIGGGGDLNLARWLHVTAIAGYRQPFGRTNTGEIVTSSGFTLTSLLVVGKPYGDR